MFREKERGAAAVEFALVVPLLLVILFGIIEFSILFYDKAVITNASREAARAWAVFRDEETVTKLNSSQIGDVVTAYVTNRLISLGSNNSPVVVTAPVDPTSFDPGDYLSLTVQYSYEFVFLPGFIQDLLPNVDLDATTVMRAE